MITTIAARRFTQAHRIMVELLLATSSLAGLTVGLVGPLWAIAITTVLVAGVSAFVTWSQNYHATDGIAVITACLVACQLSYMVGRYVTQRYGFPDLSAGDDIDGEPGDPRQRSVTDQDGDDGQPPTRSPPP